jgi:hypothetical protein
MHLMKRMEINTPVKGLGGVVLDAGVGFAASYGLGQVYHRYNDKWVGKNAPRLAAVVGKLGAVALSMAAGGHQTWMGNVVNSVGQAGVNAMGLEMGLRHARKATGKQAVLMPAGAALPSGATAIGALGRAPMGRGMSWDQISEIAQGR